MAVCLYRGIVGNYGLRDVNGHLTHLWFECNRLEDINGMLGRMGQLAEELCETPLLREAKAQLDAYFAGQLKAFSLPLAPVGTSFQQHIWTLLRQIPYAETRTYGQIATLAGNPKASRAVGLANNRNPLPIFIPCHRVIGANGTLTGYAGGLDVKTKLLELENGLFLAGR